MRWPRCGWSRDQRQREKMPENPTNSDNSSKRDRRIALMLSKGDTNAQIARELGVSRRTIERRSADPEVRKLVRQYWDRQTAGGLGVLASGFRKNCKELLRLGREGTQDDRVRLAATRA